VQLAVSVASHCARCVSSRQGRWCCPTDLDLTFPTGVAAGILPSLSVRPLRVVHHDDGNLGRGRRTLGSTAWPQVLPQTRDAFIGRQRPNVVRAVVRRHGSRLRCKQPRTEMLRGWMRCTLQVVGARPPAQSGGWRRFFGGQRLAHHSHSAQTVAGRRRGSQTGPWVTLQGRILLRSRGMPARHFPNPDPQTASSSSSPGRSVHTNRGERHTPAREGVVWACYCNDRSEVQEWSQVNVRPWPTGSAEE
jgi:hypothetical protein